MSSQGRKINQKAMYKQIIASNIFNDKPLINKDSSNININKNKNSSVKKYSNSKNDDHFKLLNETPNIIKVKTGKTFKKKPSTDILNVKKNEIQINKSFHTGKKNLSNVYFGEDKDYIVKRKPYESNYNHEKYMNHDSAFNRKIKNLYGDVKSYSLQKFRRNILSNEEKQLQKNDNSNFIKVSLKKKRK